VALRFFVGNVISGIGLGFFGLWHRALGPNPKRQFFVTFFKLREERVH